MKAYNNNNNKLIKQKVRKIFLYNYYKQNVINYKFIIYLESILLLNKI